MWKNIVEQGRPQLTIWHMRTACWIPKATDTHTDCVILIAFPLQQWLQERASMLCYTYIAHLVTHGLFHYGTQRPKNVLSLWVKSIRFCELTGCLLLISFSLMYIVFFSVVSIFLFNNNAICSKFKYPQRFIISIISICSVKMYRQVQILNSIQSIT